MTPDIHAYIISGLLGVFVHTLIRYTMLRKDAKAANLNLTVLDFLLDDWTGIILALVAIPVWYMVMPEVLTKYPELTKYNRISFFMVGMLGSYLLQLVNSKSKEKINEVVDRKTDIADGKSRDIDG